MSVERVLVVRVGSERFALPLGDVLEAVDAPEVTPVALAPRGVVGQCVHRGRLLPVVDLGRLVGVGRDPGSGAMLVLEVDRDRAGVMVDDVLDADVAHPSMRRPVPATGADASGMLDALLDLPSGLAALVDTGALRAAVLARLTAEVG